MDRIKILKRLYKDYTKKYLKQIFLAIFFSLLVAGSTSAIAWLLDPAIDSKRSIIINFNTSTNYFSIYNKRYITLFSKGDDDKCC